ncbi:hypothetical protein JHK87_024716 [Glycine soja]|nr:hypothetical protein JHK87_024716 [Glycine soja]
MVWSHKGKFFIFYLLFFFSSLHASSSPLDLESCSIQSKLDHNSCQEHVPEKPHIANNLNQQVLLDMLEELVRNLSDLVARLESKLLEPPKEKGDHEGLSKYVAVSDERGRVYVFTRNEDVLVEFDTSLESPITAMVSYTSVYKNESFVVTGHQNGEILMHRAWEGGSSGEDYSSVFMENVGREFECEGLNHSVARTYVFYAMERSKAYGFTSDRDLIYVLLLGDVMNFKCRVRYKKKFDVDEPLALQAIKGYLLIVNPKKVFVYNVSSPHYVRVGVPRPVFSSGLDELRSSFLNNSTPSLDAETRVTPLIASDHKRLVIVGLGGGYVGMYHSHLPIFKGEFNTMLWTSPVLFFILFLFGAWHFFAKKKEALTSWGPDDPFSSTSATTSVSLASGSRDRSFADSSSRSSKVMDLRGGNLRAPPRRYDSPSRYPGGAATSYRLGGVSIDHNARPASVDPNFRVASELKFRASTMDPPGFPKRRDGMFVGNQVVNDHS